MLAGRPNMDGLSSSGSWLTRSLNSLKPEKQVFMSYPYLVLGTQTEVRFYGFVFFPYIVVGAFIKKWEVKIQQE